MKQFKNLGWYKRYKRFVEGAVRKKGGKEGEKKKDT